MAAAPAHALEEVDEDASVMGALFSDPADFYPPTPPPTTQSHTLFASSPQPLTLELGLVGHSPLEAHRLWTGSRVLARYLEEQQGQQQPGAAPFVAGRTVLELGAGAGLPSLAAAVLGAGRVVVTDYPDPDLVANLWANIRACERAAAPRGLRDGVLFAEGYVWGADAGPLRAHLPGREQQPAAQTAAGQAAAGGGASGDDDTGFDLVFLADLLFRHSEHGRLVDSVMATLRRAAHAQALVFFTSYRPWLRHKDLAFFDVARERGLVVERVLEEKLDRPMFEDDPGDEEVRRTCSGYVLRWPEEALLPKTRQAEPRRDGNGEQEPAPS